MKFNDVFYFKNKQINKKQSVREWREQNYLSSENWIVSTNFSISSGQIRRAKSDPILSRPACYVNKYNETCKTQEVQQKRDTQISFKKLSNRGI